MLTQNTRGLARREQTPPFVWAGMVLAVGILIDDAIVGKERLADLCLK